MRYPEGIPEDDSPVTARGPLRRATARALLGEMAGLLRRVFRFLGLVLEEFLLVGGHFGGSSLMVSLSSLPVKRNGGW